MEILLLMPRYNLGNKKNYDYLFPLGIPYISAVLKRAGYSIDCINMNHLNGSIKEIMTNILDSKKYDFVCTGGMAIIYAVLESIIKNTRDHQSRPKIILGGQILTSEPEVIFNSLNPDVGFLGESEETVLDFFKAFQEKKDLKKVKGIMFRDANSNLVITEKREPVEDLDSLPFPDCEGFGLSEQLEHLYANNFWVHNAFDHPRVYPILCSRSCPYKCTFCYHDNKYRKRSIKNVMKELSEIVKKFKINTIIPYDECLATDKKRLKEFCNGIKKLQKEITWELRWACQIRADSSSEEIIKLIKDSGCDSIACGFESFSPTVLKSMKKNITPKQIEDMFFSIIRNKLAIQAFFIFGDVAETKETAKETLDWWKKNALGQIGIGHINPYPGSEIYNHCVRKGIITDKLDFIKNKIAPGYSMGFNMTDKMTSSEFKNLRNEVLDSFAKYTKFVKPLRIKRIEKNSYSVKIRCPFCKEKIQYNNCYIKNRFNFGFHLSCRNCMMRFFVVSAIQKFAYSNYPIARKLRDLYLNIKRSLFKRIII